MPVAYAVKPYPRSDEQFKAWIKKLRHLGFQIQNGRWSKKYESAQELRELIAHVDIEIEEADINIASPESPPQRLLAYWKQALDLANLDDLFVSPEKKSAAVLQDIPLGRIIGGNLPGRVEYIGEDTQRRGQFEAFMDGATDALKGLPKGADLAEDGTSRGVPILILLGAMKRDPKNRSQFKGRVDLAVAGWYLPTSGELTPLPSIGMLVNAKNLAPQDNPRQPLLGDADQLSTVLAEMHEAIANASSENPLAWQEYWQHIDQAFQALQRKSGLKPTSVSTFNYLPYKNSRAREHLACIGIVPAQVTNAANRQLVRLYDSLTEHNAPPALLSRLMQGESGHHAPLADWVGLRQDADAARRMHRGHMGAAFGLDATQRQAVWQAMSSRDGDWVAVSGPPGTGKTSMLQGFIASIAVEAALNQGPSPLVIASSANNQAVKNIIKAFATIAATRADDDPPALEHRWIRNLPSYGWYAPAQSAESKEENAGFQQLCRNRQGFNAFTTNGIAADFEWPITVPPDEVEALRRHFLETFEVARQTVPVLRAQAKCVSVDQVRDRLAALLANLVGDSPSSALSICLRAADELGSVPALAPYDKLCWATRRSSRLDDQRKHRETRRRFKTMRDDRRMLAEQRDALCAAIERIEVPPSSWWRRTLKTVRVILGAPDAARVAQQHLATLLARFSVSPVPDPDDWAALVRAAEVFRRELEKRENVLAQTIATRTNRIERADQLYRAWTNDSAPLIDGLKITHRVRRLLDDTARLGRSDKDAKSWTSGFGAGLQGEDAPELPGIQRDAWTIATRLRHGSLQQQDIIDDILEPCERLIDTTIRRVAFHLAMRYWEARWLIDCDSVIDGEDASAVERSLRRAAMLAPVIVATAQSMPALMGISGNSEAPPSFGWSMADWLIIDEAGQLTPQLGAPISALAKRALVVGDVEQLKPISGLDIATDRALLRVFGLNVQGPMLEQRGLAAAQGSMMAAAERAACRHRNVEEKRWGATLKFHYRCRRTIIEFCNELVYNQMDPLVPMIPDLPPETRLLPPMSFVSVPGQQTPLDGSSWNALELDHLVGWLHEQRLTIEQHYASKNGTGNSPLDLADLVAIVTPYKAQRDQIEEAIKSRLDPLYPTSGGRQPLSTRMTIGTVHALQGAECPIVLFSAVSTLDGSVAVRSAGQAVVI
ncbi:AAA domain-containing protein [Caballeronia mineralivorans]|uniref:AAA domain-containing protein n=1 Tax=Caballeronia mineralivorans TaxID=2010198 RepID=UPI0023F0BB34|nr:AAA domain-containing protein [Caballeronia mineralivorans]MDB5783955.1 helicase [Caballeronia mineralivorans]